MFGPCYRLLWLRSDDSNWFSQQCIGNINIRPNLRLCSVQLEWLMGVKDSAKRLFLGGAGPTEVHRPPGFRNILPAHVPLSDSLPTGVCLSESVSLSVCVSESVCLRVCLSPSRCHVTTAASAGVRVPAVRPRGPAPPARPVRTLTYFVSFTID